MTDSRNQSSEAPAPAASSLADLVVERPRVPFSARMPVAACVKVCILAALVVWLNHWQFRPLAASWLHDPNWGHGFIIPLFSLYLVYRRWDELLAAPRRTCLGGLAVLVLGILIMVFGFYPIGTYWICQLSMPVVMFGLVLYLGGPAIARLTWLPIFYLALAMPIPDRAYTYIAGGLQELAAWASAVLLGLFGAKIGYTMGSSHLSITSVTGQEYPLTVAEACSGMRSLIAYIALGVAWAYLENRPLWQRVVLVLMAVPIAVFCNVMRVTATCTMYVVDKPELGQQFMHTVMGLAMLVPALVLFWLLGKLLQALFVEEPEEGEPSPPQTGIKGEVKA